MNNSYPTQYHPANGGNTAPYDSNQYQYQLLLNAAKVGAVVGASGAAAYNLHRLRREEIEGRQALMNTVKVGFTTGVATAAAAAVGNMFSRHPWLSLAATLATGTAVMYVISDRKQGQAEEAGDE